MREPSLPVDAPASPVLTLVSLDAGVPVVTLSFHDEFADQVTCSASAGNVSTESIVNRWALCQCGSFKLHRLDAHIAFLLHASSKKKYKERTPLQMYSEVTLSFFGPQPPAPRLGIPVACVVYITVHFTWALLDTQPHISCAPDRFVACSWLCLSAHFTNLVAHTYRRSAPCLVLVATFAVPCTS